MDILCITSNDRSVIKENSILQTKSGVCVCTFRVQVQSCLRRHVKW